MWLLLKVSTCFDVAAGRQHRPDAERHGCNEKQQQGASTPSPRIYSRHAYSVIATVAPAASMRPAYASQQNRHNRLRMQGKQPGQLVRTATPLYPVLSLISKRQSHLADR
jgi:hypothetical protein